MQKTMTGSGGSVTVTIVTPDLSERGMKAKSKRVHDAVLKAHRTRHLARHFLSTAVGLYAPEYDLWLSVAKSGKRYSAIAGRKSRSVRETNARVDSLIKRGFADTRNTYESDGYGSGATYSRDPGNYRPFYHSGRLESAARNNPASFGGKPHARRLKIGSLPYYCVYQPNFFRAMQAVNPAENAALVGIAGSLWQEELS